MTDLVRRALLGDREAQEECTKREVVPRKGCSWCMDIGRTPQNWECALVSDYGTVTTADNEVIWTTANFCPVCGRLLEETDHENVQKL